MYTYYISVGSNIGDKQGHINLAFQSFQEHDAVSKVISSSLIETDPWDIRNRISLLIVCGFVKVS